MYGICALGVIAATYICVCEQPLKFVVIVGLEGAPKVSIDGEAVKRQLTWSSGLPKQMMV